MPNTVIVACKIPNGLVIDLADIQWTEVGGIKVAVRENVSSVTLNGNSAERRLENAGQPTGATEMVTGGYGLTVVDADFWDRWIKENENYAPVKQGLIFAQSRQQDAKAKARERRGARSGLEPMEPPNFDRMGKPIGELDPRLPPGIQTADVPTTG